MLNKDGFNLIDCTLYHPERSPHMQRRFSRVLAPSLIVLAVSLFATNNALAQSESGGFTFGAGSQSGGILSVGASSESGGVAENGSETEGGGINQTGASSESGGIANAGGETESGGIGNVGASTEGGVTSTPKIYVRYYGN
jgi:hypothetical protein